MIEKLELNRYGDERAKLNEVIDVLNALQEKAKPEEAQTGFFQVCSCNMYLSPCPIHGERTEGDTASTQPAFVPASEEEIYAIIDKAYTEWPSADYYPRQLARALVGKVASQSNKVIKGDKCLHCGCPVDKLGLPKVPFAEELADLREWKRKKVEEAKGFSEVAVSEAWNKIFWFIEKLAKEA